MLGATFVFGGLIGILLGWPRHVYWEMPNWRGYPDWFPLPLPQGFHWAIMYAVTTACVCIVTIAVIQIITDFWLVRARVRPLAHDFPSPGLWATLKIGLPVAPVLGLILGSLTGYIIGLLSVTLDGVFFGLVMGTWVTLTTLQCLGGDACRHQISIRLTLSRCDLLPMRSRQFFDYAVDCLLMRRVGKAYSFTHRTLQDFFAELYKSDRPLSRFELDVAAAQRLMPMDD